MQHHIASLMLQYSASFTVYIEHFLAGLMFAATGWYAQGYCRHVHHQIGVAILLVALETLIVVTVVG